MMRLFAPERRLVILDSLDVLLAETRYSALVRHSLADILHAQTFPCLR